MREIGIPHPRLPLPSPGQKDDPERFLSWLGEAIPLVPHLGIRSMHSEEDRLVWHLDLAPSLNDKGTGFGGALAAQVTLLGWCWVTLWLRYHSLERDVVVAEASQRYLAPVTGDYRLICRPESEEGTVSLSEQLAGRGKGRIALVQQLWCGDTLCLEAQGNYAVLGPA
jgi:thioesterase domain-containing protein